MPPAPGAPRPVLGACWRFKGTLYPPPNVRCYPPGFDPNTLPGWEGRWERIS
jgi:hypothetical protein